ncbi:MAG: M48 family metallopeptidase [Gammaproteobacteria bacterium]|nr:M48 family metallopeptidase [Gammaproteobacteria bacterium]MBT5600820.1 M48 family metallopeptidase [Gammaproteobacteria bacterium]
MRIIQVLIFVLGMLASKGQTASRDLNLPNLGDASSGIVSLPQEHNLGQQFLRAVRSQVTSMDDPLLVDYLEHLIYRLSSFSDIEDHRLYIILIKNPLINAFAAPGGVIGVNHGLFLRAESHHEMSAILAHELAHLSQRHFARGIESSKKAGVITIAGLLAGAILASAGAGDAGIAALTASQGIAQSQQLSYSRTREAEADRIGITTMINAGIDPRAMAYMFERLDRLTRYSGDLIPEFLRTHPVTRLRIADAYNQTENLTKKEWPLDLNYQLMRTRAIVLSNDPQVALSLYRENNYPKNPVLATSHQYGRALALTFSGQIEEATTLVSSLRKQSPNNIAYQIAEANLLAADNKARKAANFLETSLKINPGNYPLAMAYSDHLIQLKRPAQASQVLLELSLDRPDDETVWYNLAETLGLANDISGVHQARAEYFILNGNFDQAIKQLGYALPMVRQNFQINAKIKQRIEEIWELKTASK